MLEILSGRAGRVAAQAVVLAAVVGGTVTYSHVNKTLNLTVDGRTTQVQVDANTVRAVLASQHLRVGPHDIVAPALDATVNDGETVVVRFARHLVLTVDGRTRTYWVTDRTVGKALLGLGIHAEGARLSASRSATIGRAGFSLEVSTPKAVTLAADGRTRTLVTTAPTVGDLLSEQGVVVRSADRLSVLQSAPVTSGLVVALTRIDHKTVTVTERVPFRTVKKKSATLYTGQTKTLTAGVKGSRRATYLLVLANGKQVGRKLQSATVLKAPITRVVAVGTKARPATSSTVGGGVDSLNWAALAQCESGGNPRAVNPAGYYGLYQFSLATWRSVGGTGNPIDATPAEQTYRAKLLYKRGGAGQWGCGNKLFS